MGRRPRTPYVVAADWGSIARREALSTPQDSLRWPLALTRLGLFAERSVRAFWPLWTVLAFALAAMAFGAHERAPLELAWGGLVLTVVAAVWALIHGVRRFSWPTPQEALARLDGTLPGRPIAALADDQAIGADDPDSTLVWAAHQRRMAARLGQARAVPGNLRISDRDRYGLRYIALMFLTVAVLFGSILRVGAVTELAPAGGGAVVTGPVWEGWVEPPAYTGKPTLYLADIEDELAVAEGSRITLRLYGEPGALSVTESVSARTPAEPEGDEVVAPQDVISFEAVRSGEIGVIGPGGQVWIVTVEADQAPQVDILEGREVDAFGEFSQPFAARDDHGIVAGAARIALNLDAVERRHGLAVEPEPREDLLLDLPMPFSGDRADFEEALIEDLSEHPLANLPVTMTFEVVDAAGQTGESEILELVLPGRRFFQPVAKAVIEQRRDLLWSRENGRRVLQLLRAVGNKPEDVISNQTVYLRYRQIIRRLDLVLSQDALTPEVVDELAEALWSLAVQLEDGSLADARARLERAQDRLAEAMRNGASDEEIAELMQELRDATNEYMRMLAQRQQPQQGDGTDQPQTAEGERFEFTQDELQALMDRIEELMQEGRMAEAQELMEQLNQLMENLQVTQGEQGEGGQSPGEQAMEGLADTLREQQGLSDQAFRDLQEQFNPGAQAGQNQANEGRSGGQGEGLSHDGQGGEPGDPDQDGREQGEGRQAGREPGGDSDEGRNGEPGAGDLADRQQALRRELERQRGNLPLGGGEEADTAREALDRAGEAMDGAEEALRNNELAEAIDRQAEAMDALRDGMRALGEALARNEPENQQGQGTERGDFAADQSQRRDPLGRQQGNQGQLGTEESLLQGEDVYRRAGELLDEIRRRSAEQERPGAELEYLRRLLDRF